MNGVSALSLEQLAQENARLIALLNQQEQTIKQQQSSITSLHHQLHLFRTARFGRKSEKGVVPEQMALRFDEAIPVVEEHSLPEAASEEKQTITYTRSKKARVEKHYLNHCLT